MEKHIGLPSARRLLVAALIMGVPLTGAHATGFHDLYAFTGRNSGADPGAGLITAGELRDATANGGARSFGIVLKLAPGATEMVLHSLVARLQA
jgi:hypothetical protein